VSQDVPYVLVGMEDTSVEQIMKLLYTRKVNHT
jgi:hypothetical protein